jgi:hypothetical protein
MGRTVGARGRSNFDQLMELIAGPRGESAFASEADREQAWYLERDDLLQSGYYRPGDRPWGMWVYDYGVEEPATRLERVRWLHEHGELTAEKRERRRRARPQAVSRSRRHLAPGGGGIARARSARDGGRGDRDRGRPRGARRPGRARRASASNPSARSLRPSTTSSEVASTAAKTKGAAEAAPFEGTVVPRFEGTVVVG